MNDSNPRALPAEPPRPARNKGKLTGPKPPLRPGHVWSIRAKLQLERRTRDLALFNLAIDSKLRGCDLVALRVDDVPPNGYAVDRATVRQSKTGRPVRFELTEVTRHSLDEYLRATGRSPGQCLFPGRRGPDAHLTTRQYARLVSEWVSGIGLDAFDEEDQGDSHLSTDREPPRGATFVQEYGILPANIRQKPRSTTRFIPGSVRPLSSDGGSSRTTWRWRSFCNRTVRSPFCRHGCWTNQRHDSRYTNPQRSR
jgi:hypothetical protein